MRLASLASIFALAISVTAGCAGAPQGGPSAATPHTAKPTRSSEIVGRWAATLPETKARAFTYLRCLFADPPNTALFEKLQPEPEERKRFQQLCDLKKNEPAAPLLSTLRAELAQYEAIGIEISPTTIIFHTSEGVITAQYKVVEEDDESATLESDGERLKIHVVDHDHIWLHQGQRAGLTRDDGLGATAKDAIAALPRTGRSP